MLDNRIDLSQNNDSERGELYKFLNESEETEKNNQLLLENKPVYSFGKLKHKKTLMEEISEPISFDVPLIEKAQQTYSHDFVEE